MKIFTAQIHHSKGVNRSVMAISFSSPYSGKGYALAFAIFGGERAAYYSTTYLDYYLDRTTSILTRGTYYVHSSVWIRQQRTPEGRSGTALLPIIRLPPLIDTTHPLYRYFDTGMHQSCYENWDKKDKLELALKKEGKKR